MKSTQLLTEVRKPQPTRHEVSSPDRRPGLLSRCGAGERRAHVHARPRSAAKPRYSVSDLGDRESWIERHAPLVKRIAHYMMARLPASVEFDDVLQAGMLGLLDAVARYEETQGAQFETYAAQRIRGAIVDELRRNDWLPRSVRRTEGEIASQLSVPIEEYQHQLHQARGHQLLYSEDFDDPEGESVVDPGAPQDILDALIDDELRQRIASGVADLPAREKTVMSLYYEKELNLREIGQVLGVTESRVCQLHSQAVVRLRSQLLAR
jgi:RNA polymerase sigma factor for flagellar operon FliA